MNMIRLQQINSNLERWVKDVRTIVLRRNHSEFEAREFLKKERESYYFSTLIPSENSLQKNVDLLAIGRNYNLCKAYAVVGQYATELLLEEYKKEKFRMDTMSFMDKSNELEIDSIATLFSKATFKEETIQKLILLKHIALQDATSFTQHYYAYYDSVNEMRKQRIKCLQSY